MTLSGIDVSRWNGMANLTNQQFQFARASYANASDVRYRAHTANARAQRCIPGAYHFGTSAPVSEQVAVFLAAVRATNVRLVALDLEFNGRGQTMSDNQGAAFIAAVKHAGYKCGLYGSRSGFPRIGQDWDWIADWDASTFPPGAEFWQYQGNPIDRNKFKGSKADLLALAGVTPPPDPVVHIAPSTPAERKSPMLLGAYGVETPYVMHLAKDQPLFAHPGGPRVTRMSRAGAVTYVAKTSNSWASVIVGTGAPYSDGKTRPTGLYVPLSAGEVTPV